MKQVSLAVNIGWLISLLTFPGVILHEWAHMLFCRLSGVRVFKVRYFRLGNPAGYVQHEQVRSFWQALTIDTAPLLINSIVSFCLYLTALSLAAHTASYILYWLGISAALHAFPSREDAENLRASSRQALKRNPLALLGYPLVWLIRLAHLPGTLASGLLYAVFLFLIAAVVLHGGLLFLFPGDVSAAAQLFLAKYR